VKASGVTDERQGARLHLARRGHRGGMQGMHPPHQT